MVVDHVTWDGPEIENKSKFWDDVSCFGASLKTNDSRHSESVLLL